MEIEPEEGAPIPARPSPDIIIRASSDADVEAMVAIYEHHIGKGVGNVADFDDEARLLPDDLKRRRKTMRKKRLPHLVAERGGQVAGYAYAVPFRKRPAYRYTLKHSIYVHPDHLHAGIGRRLLPALIEACAAGGYRQMIGYIDAQNAASLRLHETCGFARVGLLKAVGFKYGRWSDSVMVQRALGTGSEDQPGS
ncbi:MULTISPECIES: GNAT family N-acetyltransferase [unclassified Methylobacterium]|uniref:GNAT family N-acetyltransferase n=1 Tax=unclassified Methylobacterium TaxID=2615210 RepID=UPI001FBB9344|nr:MULTISPECIES: GNAT family N-acetyltransferase [unclassified Methylobacterium]MCJ2095228.1 GNAT family N-acetyltransferase [Methylobacterium sp. J-072]MCJ2140222.1 GNAT family N-acetyltransferase [Methylobacterium sp. E-066]